MHGKAHILRREETFVAVALLGACQKIKCPSTAQSFENAFLPWPIARAFETREFGDGGGASSIPSPG